MNRVSIIYNEKNSNGRRKEYLIYDEARNHKLMYIMRISQMPRGLEDYRPEIKITPALATGLVPSILTTGSGLSTKLNIIFETNELTADSITESTIDEYIEDTEFAKLAISEILKVYNNYAIE